MKRIWITMCLSLLIIGAGFAGGEEGFRVDEIVLCTSVEDRQPVGSGTEFPVSVERVYCFTRLSGAPDTTSIRHVWKFDGVEKAQIVLHVGAESWRTWSSKRIIPEWAGTWTVDVLSAAGDLLAKKEFRIGE
ncbi:MAG TPA: DUF2914 domain-containing protein [bacterium]|nr:DUF2914 domain-containing protein [bacterium]